MVKTKSRKVKGLMKVLMALSYKGNRIYIRLIGNDVFIWDAVFNGELFSSYMVITPDKDKTELTKEQIEEVVKMCYAGAAATIDGQLGLKLSKTDKENVKIFEEARKTNKIKKEDLN